MECYLCNSVDIAPVDGLVRDRPDISIHRCLSCGLVFLGSFDHIHEDFYNTDYTTENHSHLDWSKFLNECTIDDSRRFKQIQSLVTNKVYCDVGCGAGGVLLKARDIASQVIGVEPQPAWKYCLSDSNIDIFSSVDELKDLSYDVISLFHVLEHISDPIPFLETLLTKVIPGGKLIIEVPNADDALLSVYKSKEFSRFTYWSPHLFLYNSSTLTQLFLKAGLSRDQFEISYFQRYPLSNHLYWLSHGRPGGHIEWSFLDSPLMQEAYSSRLASLGKTDTLFATICR